MPLPSPMNPLIALQGPQPGLQPQMTWQHGRRRLVPAQELERILSGAQAGSPA